MIAHQRETAAGKLHPNLVAAAGVQANVYQRLFAATQTVELQSCVFNTFAFFLNGKNLVLFAILE